MKNKILKLALSSVMHDNKKDNIFCDSYKNINI